MHLQWVSLLFAISPLQFLFFLQKQKKNQKTRKNKQTASDPLPLGCAILFLLLFFCFFGFLVFCFLGSLLF